MNDTLIRVRGLYKYYNIPDKKFMENANPLLKLFYRKYVKFYALKNISFDIMQEEIVGYIGRNGAGKTTTLKILAGILEPSKGEVKILGRDPYKHRKEISKYISILFGNREMLFFDIPLIDSLSFFRKMYDISKPDFEARVEELSKKLDISSFLTMPVRKMSFGERKKANILAAFLHQPRLVLLDEPTIGLDIFAKDEIRSFLRYINKEEGTTIILTSHYMEDIEELSTRVILIDEGRLIVDESYEKIIQRVDYKIIEIFLSSKPPSRLSLSFPHKIISKKPTIMKIITKKEHVREAIKEITKYTEDINVYTPTLEDIIKGGMLGGIKNDSRSR